MASSFNEFKMALPVPVIGNRGMLRSLIFSLIQLQLIILVRAKFCQASTHKLNNS